jgi:E3 ubiquitin-protein ligase HUWE1
VRFNWRAVRSLVRQLADDFDDELAQEAAYRTHGNPVTAPAYCSAHESEIAGTRNPVPLEDIPDASSLAEGNTPTTSRDASGSRVPDPEAMSLDTSPETSAETLDDLISRLPENDDLASESGADAAPKAAEPISPSGEENSTEQYTAASFNLLKEDLDNHRSKLRDNLIGQCLDVIRTHPDTAIEVSELIVTVVLRHQNAEAHKDVGLTLTSALTSLSLDENDKKLNGKCIAAYAHLLALLLQDETFFERNSGTLSEKIDEYAAFLRIPPSTSTEELPPWIPFILLVLETLLSHDEKPVAVHWNAPKSLDEPAVVPLIKLGPLLVDDEQRSNILESLLDLLPRIGKEEMLATAILRVLIILTRKRQLAKQVGEKKNLQRLFLMAKQMSGSGSERLRQTRLTAHLITILRHIVEDEDVIKQIMRAEIKSDLPNLQRTQRGHLDVTTYIRAMAPVALRAPDLFVEVTNELLRFSRWNAPTSEGARSQALVWKEQDDGNTDAAQPDSENVEAEVVKQSTESGDKEMSDAHKPHHDSKRPVVENPDGVIHFLLCELVNYREVEDKEVPKAGKDVKSESESATAAEAQDNSSVDGTAGDGKDKKPPKPTFKPEEHPIFVYRCFLLSCLAELLQSYTRTKVEFINFKRSAPPLSTNTPVKPRSSILNYLIYDLLCQSNLSGTSDNIASKKKAATSSQTQKVLVALVSKTNEKVFERKQEKYAYDDEPDLLFVRKFVLDTILKAYEKAPLTDEPLEVRYARMQCLAELMNHMVGERDKEQSSGSRNADSVQSRSQAQLRRLMYEKGYLDKLTSSIAEINLNFPGVKRAIKYILRVLRVLTDTAKELSHSNILVTDSQADQSDEDFASTSSLSDLDDGREETPDLYRNSALGMLEPRGEDDESESEEEDNDDEDMYGDDYDDDEMDYGDEEISDDEDNISDEDEGLSEMGEIEGLHGDPGVVEVIMDDDDEDDDDDSDDDDDEDDEVDSADMEDVEDRVEIVDEDGNLIDDDGESGWESETSVEEDEGPEVDDIDYEAEAQEEDEAHLHGMGPGDLLDNMARAIMGGDEDGYEPELMEALDEHYMDDGHDEGGT